MPAKCPSRTAKISSAVVSEKKHQEQDDRRNHGQAAVVNDLARQLRFALLPVAQLWPVFDAHPVHMFQIIQKLARMGVPVFRFALQSSIENLLQLRRD